MTQGAPPRGVGVAITLDFQWLTPVSDLIVIYSRDHDPTTMFPFRLDRHRVVIGTQLRSRGLGPR
jgi:hypothetical protein